MKNKETINWNLAGRILSGEALESEIKAFNHWLADSENKKEWDDITQKLEHADHALVAEKIDLEAAWQKVKNQTSVKSLKPFYARYSYVAVAASILIAIFVFFNQKNNFFGHEQFITAEALNAIEKVELNDGSTIDVNRNSSVQFPQKFARNNRSVTLNGEAFFDIAADKTRPFIIEAGLIQVKVVGTSFNIKAYPNSELSEVVVNSGIVEVSSLKDVRNKIILKAGDRAIYNSNNNTLTKHVNTNVNYLAWKTQELAFKNEKLTDAIALIEHVYNVNIEVPENFAMDSAMITATFDKNTIDFIIDVINKTHGIELRYKLN
ncbi:DUF4974 domain-containing protein [Labilibacter sediminis]|nr:DUF4974 domain-containing protein [Labilibacter sediminis]